MLWPRTPLKRSEDLARMCELAPGHERRNELRQNVPGRRRRLGAVERIGVRNTLPDAADAFPLDGDQEKGPFVDSSEARFEKTDEREAQETKLDALD